MCIDERVVMATALVHTVPGSALVVADEEGRLLTIGRHPSAEIDPCRWRHAVARAVRRDDPGLGAVTLVDLTGSVARTPSGAFVDARDPNRRWMVTTLAPCAVASTLRAVELRDLDVDAVTATVRPDPELGVTSVAVGVSDAALVPALDALAGEVVASLLVAELGSSLPIRR